MQRDRGAYYRPELDVLRFFAFLLVYVHHALQYASPYGVFDPGSAKVVASLIAAGGLGVDLFFVLSAFLITKLLLIEQRTTGAIHVPSFLARRALRIWPLYFAFLLASMYLIPHLLPREHLGRHFVWFLLFVGNWACALFGYPQSVAAPLWSVSIEEQFYLVWPLLLVALGTRRIAVAACVLLVVAFCTRLLLWAHGAVHPAVWANTLARLDPIAVGILLAWLSEKDLLKLNRRRQLLLMTVGALVPPAAMVMLGGSDAFAGDASLALYPVVALGWGFCCSASFSGRDRRRVGFIVRA